MRGAPSLLSSAYVSIRQHEPVGDASRHLSSAYVSMPVGDVSRHLLDGMLESSDSISLKNVKKEEGNKFKKEERNTEEYFVLLV